MISTTSVGAEISAAASRTEVPLLRLNVSELARALGGLRQTLAGLTAEKERQQVDQMLDHVQRTLALFERLEITQRTEAGQLLLTARLTVSK